MYDEGYTDITNNDISTICIKAMKKRNDELRPLMRFDIMDVREMSYMDSTFDLIIDKSTIDALLCGSTAYLNVAIMLKECQRTLNTGGFYVAISYGAPGGREYHFKRDYLGFKLSTFKIEKHNAESLKNPSAPLTVHYVYVCQKLEEAN